MGKLRVLVVDDAVVVRRLLTEVLTADPQIEVAGTAANGHIALAKLEQLAPDLVTLDVEMPEMDGLQTLTALRKTHPRLPVIMFSTLTERGAAATLDALTLGATDYVTKPANVGSVGQAMQRIRDELIPKIKHYCGRSSSFPEGNPVPTPRPAAPKPADSSSGRGPTAPGGPRLLTRPVEVVALGVSTGGPNALARVLSQLPRDFPVPIVLVQHMPPVFTHMLALRLDANSQMNVREGRPGTLLQRGVAYVAPGDFHMTVAREGSGVRLRTNQGPQENSCRPAVDPLFRSVADVYGGAVLAVILTGMGQDGLRGSEAIREAGGQVIVQDEATSVVWGMPGFVARAGLADAVLPLEQMGHEIIRRVARNRAPATPARTRPTKEDVACR